MQKYHPEKTISDKSLMIGNIFRMIEIIKIYAKNYSVTSPGPWKKYLRQFYKKSLDNFGKKIKKIQDLFKNSYFFKHFYDLTGPKYSIFLRGFRIWYQNYTFPTTNVQKTWFYVKKFGHFLGNFFGNLFLGIGGGLFCVRTLTQYQNQR